MIDLRPDHLALVREILAAHVPNCEVRVFGSRVDGTARPASDLDLALVCDAPIDWRTLAQLRMAFEESLLPFNVDILDWQRIPLHFKESILARYERLEEGTNT